MYIDINILQSVPSSNINRDDTGAPKTAVYGGATRGRVSSQSWKRATRLAFERGGFENAMRTRMMPQLLLDRMNYPLTKVRGFFVLGTLNLKYNVSIEWASSN